MIDCNNYINIQTFLLLLKKIFYLISYYYYYYFIIIIIIIITIITIRPRLTVLVWDVKERTHSVFETSRGRSPRSDGLSLFCSGGTTILSNKIVNCMAAICA